MGDTAKNSTLPPPTILFASLDAPETPHAPINQEFIRKITCHIKVIPGRKLKFLLLLVLPWVTLRHVWCVVGSSNPVAQYVYVYTQQELPIYPDRSFPSLFMHPCISRPSTGAMARQRWLSQNRRIRRVRRGCRVHGLKHGTTST